ncbi:MAG: PEGA domain-containing protein, partial [Gemmatimonadetes bacterium]|nr:PEGA domain-containing protein [Gemmatimonadota bacterium]
LLRREPDQRFQSARELKDALQRVQAGGLEADVGSLRVLTEPKGVKVEIRHGRRTVAEGPTPCVANGIAAGSYRVVVKDDRFEPLETVVSLGAGAIEDVPLAVTPRAKGVAAGVRRRPALVVAAALAVVALAAVGILQPWGRTLDVQGVKDKGASGGIASARLAPDGVRGSLRLGPLSVPFKVPVAEADLGATVADLRAAGLDLDTSWEVARIVGLAQAAQAAGRYFGRDGEDVKSYAQRLAALEPASPEAKSLLLKVAERMAWDADAALQDGESARARELAQACLALVPAHPRCAALGGGS